MKIYRGMVGQRILTREKRKSTSPSLTVSSACGFYLGRDDSTGHEKYQWALRRWYEACKYQSPFQIGLVHH